MTVNEAIKYIEAINQAYKGYPEELNEACGIAISAIKEIQLYKDGKLCLIPEDVYSRQCIELDEYKEIGTVEECRGAVEKQKPMIVNEVHVDEYYCPACGSENCCEQGEVHDKYCPVCGHAIYQKKARNNMDAVKFVKRVGKNVR